MEQLVALGKHRDHKGYGRARPIYSTIHSISPRSRDDSNARDDRAVFPGHVIQLRYDLAVHKTKALLNSLPTAPSNSSPNTGRLKSARLLPMGVVHGNNSEEKCLGIVTARQAWSRASTMPAIPIKSSKAIIHGNSDTTRRRARSAIPSSHTSMNIDDLLTVSTTRILNMSRYRTSLCKQSRDRRPHDQRLHNKEQESELTQKDKAIQQSDSMPTTITDSNIKIKIRLGHHQPSEPSELPALPEANKQDSKHFSLTTNKQSVLKKPCATGKLSPLTGAYSRLPIGTLNGNSLRSTCKNDAIKSS